MKPTRPSGSRPTTPGSSKGDAIPWNKLGDPVNSIDRDTLRKRRRDMTKVPFEIEPRGVVKKPGNNDSDHNGDWDHDGGWDRDGDHHRNYGCNRHDHSHCDHSYWHWDHSWGNHWSHRTLYRYHWFAGSHFNDFYGYGLYISFHGSRFYHPWYHTNTVVYVSPRYSGHVYYGVDHDPTGDAAVVALEQGWEALEYGDWTTARRRFARASSLAPQWGLPRIGYAIACAASGNTQSAARLMVQAFERDPYAAIEIPWTDPILGVISDLEQYYTDQGVSGYHESQNWFMAATLRLMLNDPDGAADAAFAAEVSGNESDALQGLFDVLSGQEWETP